MTRVPHACLTIFMMLAVICINTQAMARKLKPEARFKPSSTVMFSIMRTLPHASNYFTEGLAFCGGSMIESLGLYGGSALIRRQIDDGAELARRDLPAHMFGEGATCFGDRIYQLTRSAEHTSELQSLMRI